MKTYKRRYEYIIAVYTTNMAIGGEMGADKMCRFCKGTGVIICTTGKDGEMKVPCSCSREKMEKKETLENKINMMAVHVGT